MEGKDEDTSVSFPLNSSDKGILLAVEAGEVGGTMTLDDDDEEEEEAET